MNEVYFVTTLQPTTRCCKSVQLPMFRLCFRRNFVDLISPLWQPKSDFCFTVFWVWGFCTVCEVNLWTTFRKHLWVSSSLVTNRNKNKNMNSYTYWWTVKMGPTAVSETSSVNLPRTTCINSKVKKTALYSRWKCKIENLFSWKFWNSLDNKEEERRIKDIMACVSCFDFDPSKRFLRNFVSIYTFGVFLNAAHFDFLASKTIWRTRECVRRKRHQRRYV